MDVATDVLPKQSLTPSSRSTTVETDRLWGEYWSDASDETRNALVEAYQFLVRRIVQRFGARLPRMVDRGDLHTAANVGLMAAISSYDPARQVRFESYSESRIRGALLDELRSQDWLPRPWRHRIELQKRTLESLRSQLGREPLDEEVALEMDLPIAEYLMLFGTVLPGASGSGRPARDFDEDPGSTLEVVPDTKGDAPGETLNRTELLRLVAQKLTEQEYRIVYLKYWEELPMREIGVLTGLSESRVCKIHARLLERLKDRFRVDTDEE